jgi:hypothetical protein
MGERAVARQHWRRLSGSRFAKLLKPSKLAQPEIVSKFVGVEQLWQLEHRHQCPVAATPTQPYPGAVSYLVIHTILGHPQKVTKYEHDE